MLAAMAPTAHAAAAMILILLDIGLPPTRRTALIA
jgi:hypothetical protein